MSRPFSGLSLFFRFSPDQTSHLPARPSISLLCYVGHEGGALEHQSVLKEAERLQDSGSYSFYHFDRSPLCPKLVIVQKNCVN